MKWKSVLVLIICLTFFISCSAKTSETDKSETHENESSQLSTDMSDSFEADLKSSIPSEVMSDIHDLSALYIKDVMTITVEIISADGFYFPDVAKAICSASKDIVSDYDINNCTITFLEYTEYKNKDTLAYSWKTEDYGDTGIFTDDTTKQLYFDYTIDDICGLLKSTTTN